MPREREREVGKKVTFGLNTLQSARYSHKRSTYICNTEVFYSGTGFFTCNNTIRRLRAVDDSLDMRFFHVPRCHSLKVARMVDQQDAMDG